MPSSRDFYKRQRNAAGDDERAGTIRVGGIVPLGVDLLDAAEDVPGLPTAPEGTGRTGIAW